MAGNGKSLTIFSGRSNPPFALKICEHLSVELGQCEVIRFSDGELSVDIGDNVRGRDVFVVQSTSTPGNDYLMELLIIIDALKRASAYRITAVLPYFGYARQDRKLKARVPITAKLVADLITTAGTDRVLTMDLHAGQIMGFFNIPVDNMYSSPVMLPYLRSKYGAEELTIVSPDVGGVERARHYATRLDNTPIAIIDKRRSGPKEAKALHLIGDVRDKTAIILDDMIDTAGTISLAANALKEAGAKAVYASCTHPVLSGPAMQRIQDSAIKRLVVTDSINLPADRRIEKIDEISVGNLMGEAIKRIHENKPVSPLFESMANIDK